MSASFSPTKMNPRPPYRPPTDKPRQTGGRPHGDRSTDRAGLRRENRRPSLAEYSWFLRSAPRTQNPSAFSRLTKCPPMKPPAPHTNAVRISTTPQKADSDVRAKQRERQALPAHFVGPAISCRPSYFVWRGGAFQVAAGLRRVATLNGLERCGRPRRSWSSSRRVLGHGFVPQTQDVVPKLYAFPGRRFFGSGFWAQRRNGVAGTQGSPVASASRQGARYYAFSLWK